MIVRKDFLPLSRPTIGHKEIQAVVRCLKSGWITSGLLSQNFEQSFSALTGAPSLSVSISSATAAMHLVLTALGIGPGDEVITPSMTFASTVNMISLLGAKPVFVDVDYGTLNVNTEEIETKITSRTRVIIPVHFAGAPVDMDEILKIAKKHGLTVIEDAALAVGTYYKGTHIGGFGNIAIFSFHPLKNITCGEGGMITLNDNVLEKTLRLLRFHGIERDAWSRYEIGGTPEYDVINPGFKYNLTDIQAALGLAQLEQFTSFSKRRRKLAQLYLNLLADVDGIDLPKVPSYDHVHAWNLFVVKIKSINRNHFMARLSDYNIGYGYHYPAAHLLTYIKERFKTHRGLLPQTELASERIVSLPLYPDMVEDDVSYVCEAIKEILYDNGG